MKLGIDTYALRWQGWNAYQLIEYCARIGVDVVHIGRGELESLDEGYLRSFRQRADELGLGLELAMGSISKYTSYFRAEHGPAEEQFARMLPVARILGSPAIQVSIGGTAERLGPVPFAEQVAEAKRVLRAVAPLVRESGIKPAVETHGDIYARELKALVEEIGPDVVGVCLDPGNPAYLGEDPALTAELLAPYTITSHVRDSRVWLVADGAMAQWVPMGQGNVDMRRIVDLLTEHSPAMSFNLEILTASPPRHLRFADPDSEFWRLCPDMLARDLMRYVALARTGKPEPFEQIMLPPGQRVPGADDLGDRLREQQRRHIEESVRYCRESLGLGERS